MTAPSGQSWVPERGVFIRRTALIAVLTLLFLMSPILIFGHHEEVSVAWNWLIAGLLSLGFLIEDQLKWRVLKNDRWTLSEGSLNHHDKNGTSTIPLAQVKKIKVRFGTRVILTLSSGQNVEIKYLSDPRSVAKLITEKIPPSA